jgi:DNA modification methylase
MKYINEIINEDCLEGLKKIPNGVFNCCVTSPPYFGLRDYGVNGQIGLEPTPDEFVSKLVEVFREVRRTLRDDGTLWLNLGDSYAANAANAAAGDKLFGNPEFNKNRPSRENTKTAAKRVPPGLKTKDLIGIPWRVAFALQADGWYLRQDIIWHKPNPMPESVKDRCTKSHEYIFLLSKSPKYYFDSDAIKVPLAETSKKRLSQNIDAQKGSDRVPGKSNGAMKAVGSYVGGKKHLHIESSEKFSTRNSNGQEWSNGDGKANKRSVWTVATKPFKDAHFATFPPDLIEPCILAGCPQVGLVLDPFGGAGTTAVVCENLGRNYTLFELNPEYINIANKRLIL